MKLLAGTILFLIFITLFLSFQAGFVMFLWNYLAVDLGLPALSFIKSMALYVICNVLFKSGQFSSVTEAVKKKVS